MKNSTNNPSKYRYYTQMLAYENENMLLRATIRFDKIEMGKLKSYVDELKYDKNNLKQELSVSNKAIKKMKEEIEILNRNIKQLNKITEPHRAELSRLRSIEKQYKYQNNKEGQYEESL